MQLSLSEIEAKALRLIRKACPSELMDVVALKSDQKSRLIFIVLQCKGTVDAENSIADRKED